MRPKPAMWWDYRSPAQKQWTSASKRGARTSIGPKILLAAVLVVAGVIGLSGIDPQATDAEWTQDSNDTHLPKMPSATSDARSQAVRHCRGDSAAANPRSCHYGLCLGLIVGLGGCVRTGATAHFGGGGRAAGGDGDAAGLRGDSQGRGGAAGSFGSHRDQVGRQAEGRRGQEEGRAGRAPPTPLHRRLRPVWRWLGRLARWLVGLLAHHHFRLNRIAGAFARRRFDICAFQQLNISSRSSGAHPTCWRRVRSASDRCRRARGNRGGRKERRAARRHSPLRRQRNLCYNARAPRTILGTCERPRSIRHLRAVRSNHDSDLGGRR